MVMLTSSKSRAIRFISFLAACTIMALIFGMFASAEVTCDIPVSRSFDWSVNANKSKVSTTELYLYPGDIVYFNCTYTPSVSGVKFGLSGPSGVKMQSASSGSFKYTMTITEEGIYKVRVSNQSSSTIKAKGTYSTGCTYPFRSPNIAKKLSQGYGSSHYGIDIVASTAGAIYGYKIYSTGSGTVKVATYSSTAGYYVVVVGDGGLTTRYLHMKSQPSVSVNDTVTQSTLLGYVGSTGTSSGAHLHLDVNTVGAYYGGTNSNNVNKDTTINPVTLFPQISFD